MSIAESKPVAWPDAGAGPMKTAARLRGIRILLPRIAGAAADLRRRIYEVGGEAVTVEVLRITAPRDPAALLRELQNLARVDMLIFVSVSAVRRAAEVLRRNNLCVPATACVAAIGPATAAALAGANIHTDFVARARLDSDGLLQALQDFPMAEKTVLIFRGQSGRARLQEELTARGARVRHVESYRREVAEPLASELFARRFHFVLIRSAAMLDALLKLTPSARRAAVRATPVVTYSARLAAYCRARGMRAAVTVTQPVDTEVINCLLQQAAQPYTII